MTGASSGIGFATAQRLALAGWRVIAGIRDPRAAERLLAIDGRVEPLILDITADADIDALGDHLARLAPKGLSALVNNAGTVTVGPIEMLTAAQWRASLETNIIGATQVTRVALPGLRQARGRVVNVSSPSGRIALPLLGPYAVGKFAMEAFNDALRREVARLGVSVVCIQPGLVATPIFEKGLTAADAMVARADDQTWARYASLATSARDAAESGARKGRSPEEVAALIERVLRARVPKRRYTLGVDARLATIGSRVLSDGLLDRALAHLTAS